MRVGMLWFDDSKERMLAQKVERAALHYEGKYNVMPTLRHVHPTTWDKSPSTLMVEGRDGTKSPIHMVGTSAILPHHFWVGMEDKS